MSFHYYGTTTIGVSSDKPHIGKSLLYRVKRPLPGAGSSSSGQRLRSLGPNSRMRWVLEPDHRIRESHHYRSDTLPTISFTYSMYNIRRTILITKYWVLHSRPHRCNNYYFHSLFLSNLCKDPSAATTDTNLNHRTGVYLCKRWKERPFPFLQYVPKPRKNTHGSNRTHHNGVEGVSLVLHRSRTKRLSSWVSRGKYSVS